MKHKIRIEFYDYRILLRNIPATAVTFFALSVIMMNLLANREIDTHTNWLALDCGFSVSWFGFLAMDIITKRFGAKASIKLSIFVLFVNLFICMLLYLVTRLPGNWGEYYVQGDEIVNKALDNTFGGTWYVVLGSSVAFIISAIVNSTLNECIGNKLHKNNFVSFVIRSYTSTFIGQFVDNLIFAILVSYIFFGWSMLQVVMCSLIAGIFELCCEAVFSPIGYAVCRRWERDNVGIEYIKHIEEN